MVIPLIDRRGKVAETFVVRAQSMHTCIRMAARIVQSYIRGGPLMIRAEKYNFAEVWDSMLGDHERQFAPERWISIYYDGKPVFKSGDHHLFLDVVEKCDAKNPGNYDNALSLAEQAFMATGKHVKIQHDANIGLVVNVSAKEGKCGLILRNPNKKTTFNFICQNKGTNTVSITQCLNIAAAYLEGVQLAFKIGMIGEKLRLFVLDRYSNEDYLADSGARRLGRLKSEIADFEDKLSVWYRPERPEFSDIIVEAEKFARDQVMAQHEEQMKREEDAKKAGGEAVKIKDKK